MNTYKSTNSLECPRISSKVILPSFLSLLILLAAPLVVVVKIICIKAPLNDSLTLHNITRNKLHNK